MCHRVPVETGELPVVTGTTATMRLLLTQLRPPWLVASTFSHPATWPAHGYTGLLMGVPQDWDTDIFLQTRHVLAFASARSLGALL